MVAAEPAARAAPVTSPRSGKLRRVSRTTYFLLADAEPEDGDGARPRAADRFQVYPRQARGGEADAVAEQHRQDVYQDLVDEPPPQALAGHVGAEDLQVLGTGGAARRGDGFPDVTGEERDRRVRRVRRPVGEDELGSGPSPAVVFAAYLAAARGLDVLELLGKALDPAQARRLTAPRSPPRSSAPAAGTSRAKPTRSWPRCAASTSASRRRWPRLTPPPQGR
jgi:hypothetical protein